MQSIVQTFTHYRYKALYNNVFPSTIFMDLLKISHIYRTHPNFNNANLVVKSDT